MAILTGLPAPDPLFDDLPRGDPNRSPESFSPPAQAFASASNISQTQALKYGPGRIFLGVIDGTVLRADNGKTLEAERYVAGGTPVGISDPRHILTVAGSRAGKGRAAVVPNMLRYEGSVLATDPKGELATITARRRSEGLRQAVHVLDPFEVAKGHAEGFRKSFNPVAAIRQQSLVEDAALIADALVVVAEKDPHWDENARSFIEGVLLYVKTSKLYQDRGTLIDVRRLTSKGETGPDGVASMEVLQTQMVNLGGVIETAAIDYFSRPPREKESVASAVRRHLKFLDYPGIKKVVAKHDFSIDDLKKKPTTIYLCLPARHIGTCARWLRLFVNLMLQAMERLPGKPANGLPVLCCLDEFASLGHMRQIEDAAGQIAGFGVKLWPILQDLGQLKALYHERWETFMGNAGILQFFGNNDLTTLKWISERCDKTFIRSRQDSPVTSKQSEQGAIGGSWRTEVHDLITPGEIAQLFGRDDRKLRQLVIWAGRPPLILQRVYYDKHELFEGLFDEIPDDIAADGAAP